MIGFEFTDNRFLMASFEVRREKGEKFHPWTGMWNEFELILIWATERDLLGVRTNARGNDVYLYPCDVIPEKQTALLEAMMHRTNQLAETPEWYNTITATCTLRLLRLSIESLRSSPFTGELTCRDIHPGPLGIGHQASSFKARSAAISEKAKAFGLGDPGTHDYSINVRNDTTKAHRFRFELDPECHIVEAAC